jgi:hypothetical protein
MSRIHHWLPSCTAALLCGALTSAAHADTPNGGGENARCNVRELEYALSARIQLSDTPFGAGDGTYQIGPGSLVLRLTAAPMSPETYRVELIDYRMRSRFQVRSKVLFWSARVTSQTESRVASGTAGRGTLSGGKLTWSTPVQGYRTDGMLTCAGSGCGMSGAPPEGQSELHIGPEAVKFAPFTFAGNDLDTFSMPYTRLTHTEQPRQTTHLALGGRKMKDRCIDQGSS